MHKKFEINWTKIKGGCQSRRKVVTHNSKGDFPLVVGALQVIIAFTDNCKNKICLHGIKEGFSSAYFLTMKKKYVHDHSPQHYQKTLL